MGIENKAGRLVLRSLLPVIASLLLSSCGSTLASHRVPGIGMEGRYLEGKDQFLRGMGGNMDRAVASLESVVLEDPTYKDSLTLLARAYYNKERYQDAYAIIRRALAINKEDEIAWLVLGLTQLRLGDNERGLESLKGGITLLSRVSVSGYRKYEDWDTKGLVRSSIQRSAFLTAQGLESKQKLIAAVENLLRRVDDEENFQRVDSRQQHRLSQ